jgi:transcriptional regulator with XRE-family HTH domain
MAQLLRMHAMDTHWFHDTLAAKRLSQRGLARLLGCNAASVNRLVNGKRALRFDEAEKLAVFLGQNVAEILTRAGISVADHGVMTTRLVGYIDGAGEAHIDWNANGEAVPGLPDLPASTVAVQYRTAMTAWESMDGWTVYVDPPTNGHVLPAVNRLSLVTLDSGMTVIGFLRRGYKAGTYSVHNFGGANLDNVGVSWATPVLLLRP